MPTYEYSCPKCGAFDAVQSIKAEPLTTCPTCGSPVKKLIGRNVTVLYRCDGFHNTDYRSDAYKSKAKQDGLSASAPSEKPSEKPSKKTSEKTSEKKTGD